MGCINWVICKKDDGKQNNSTGVEHYSSIYTRMKMHQRLRDLNGTHLVGLYDGLGCEYDGDVGEYVGDVGL